MARDYYFILGVDPDASQDQIKSAYRREAKRCHPDLSGEGSEPFLAIREAYEVLGDRKRRQDYDAAMAREQRVQAPATVRPEPLRSRRCPAEPLVPTGRWSASRTGTVSPLDAAWSGPGSLFQSEPRGRLQEVEVQVPLTGEQALRGGRARVWIPVLDRCPVCQGQGFRGLFACPHCSGTGRIVDERAVDIAFPGGLEDGDVGRLSLNDVGLGVDLLVHFSVRPW